MWLEYSGYLISHIKGTLKEYRWINTYKFWKELREYEKSYNEIKGNLKVTLIQIRGANALTYNLNQLRGELLDKKQDFSTEVLKMYLKYLAASEGGFLSIILLFYTNFSSIFGIGTFATYIFFSLAIWCIVTIFFYPKILT